MRHKTWAAALTLLILTFNGCGPFGNNGPAEDPLVAALRASYTAHTVDAVIEALADSGVGVYDTTDDSTPVRPVKPPAVPLKFLRWQARSLALDVTTPGAGLSGDDLDSLAPVPSGYLPTSYLVAAYVKSEITPGAKLARALMGNLDWTHPAAITFPIVVLVFLLADAARLEQYGLTTPAASVQEAGPRSVRTITVSNLCTFLANWEDEVFATLFNLLTVPPSSNAILNFLGTIWNIGINLVEEALKAIINALTAPVVNAIRSVIAVIAVASEAITLLRPIKVSLTANPPFNRYSNNPGTVTAALIDPDGAEWPQALQDCLAAFGLQLPPLSGANRDPVKWSVQPLGPVVVTSMQTQLDGSSMARLTYVTGQDTPSCSPGADDVVEFRVTVHKAAGDDLKQFLLNFFNGTIGQIPAIIRDVIQPKLDELLLGVLDDLVSLSDVQDRRFVRIEHSHLPPSACVTPTPSGSPSSSSTPAQFGIGNCDQLIYPGDTIAPVVDPSERVAPGGIFDLNCPIGDPTDESLSKGFVVYYRYPSAFGAKQLIDELLAKGAASVNGVGDQAVVIPNCQRMVGATPFAASCALARLCNQVVEARIQDENALALVTLILHRLPTACPTNQTPSIPPSSLPTPLPPTPPSSPTPTPS